MEDQDIVFQEDMIKVELPEGHVDPYTHIENYLLDIRGLSPEKKMVLIMLRRYVGSSKNAETGKVEAKKDGGWPSINSIAATSGISRPTVIKSIAFFEWLRWIKKKKKRNEKQEFIANTYILKVNFIEICLKSFNERDISMKDIEDYFNTLYQASSKDNKGPKELLNKGCIFLSNSYNKEIADEIIAPYRKPPKKKRAVK